MFRNYLMVAFRNLIRQKGYSLINILGLAIGMALCLLILVYVQDELSYDGFHEKADRIYRIAQVENHDGQILHYMRIGAGINSRLETDFPEAIEKRLDLYITGEPRHGSYWIAKEAGINVIFAGHYATETLGVKALGAHLEKKFSLEVEMIELPTGL